MKDLRLEPGWKKHLKDLFQEPSFVRLKTFLNQELKDGKIIFPSPKNIFSAFDHCPFENVKVVILGQDPYHSVSTVQGKSIPTAHGLCFSVVKGASVPPSLKNIYQELAQDLGPENFTLPDHGNLLSWADQGILLLNTTLTVEAHRPMSHAGKGWEDFTDGVLKILSQEKENLIFLLWGRHAQAKKKLIDPRKHIILQAPHPSPFSARNGFFGCRHFSRTNAALERIGKNPIDWQV